MALQALLDAAIRPKTLNLRVGAPVLLGDQLLDELTPASHHEVELRGLLIGQRRNPWLQRCSKLSQAGCVHLVGLGQAVRAQNAYCCGDSPPQRGARVRSASRKQRFRSLSWLLRSSSAGSLKNLVTTSLELSRPMGDSQPVFATIAARFRSAFRRVLTGTATAITEEFRPTSIVSGYRSGSLPHARKARRGKRRPPPAAHSCSPAGSATGATPSSS